VQLKGRQQPQDEQRHDPIAHLFHAQPVCQGYVVDAVHGEAQSDGRCYDQLELGVDVHHTSDPHYWNDRTELEIITLAAKEPGQGLAHDFRALAWSAANLIARAAAKLKRIAALASTLALTVETARR
jgi:hypothetical protein